MTSETTETMDKTTQPGKLYGILAEVPNPRALMEVAETVKNSGYTAWDTFSPFPMHGIDQAMGLKKSKLGGIVLSHGLIGFFGALLMIWFMGVVDYPLNISGKPLFNVPAWIPVTFELTVLLSAFGAVFGMFFLNGLPQLNHPLFNSERFEKVTDDGFFVCIEASDPQFDREKVRSLLEKAGATHIEEIADE